LSSVRKPWGDVDSTVVPAMIDRVPPMLINYGEG
jgi:hypothetical protein